MVYSDVKKIEVFIDHTTMPVINFFLHFAERYNDLDTIRLFALRRYNIPQSIEERYPNVQSCFITCDDYSAIYSLFSETIDKYENIDVTFHLNVSHAINAFAPLWIICSLCKRKFSNIQLELYDEGSLGVFNLYNFLESGISIDELIAQNLEGVENFAESFKLDFRNRTIVNYLLNHVVPTTYHLLNTACLDKYNEFSSLRESIGMYKQMDFNRYKSLNSEQKNIFLELFGLGVDFEDSLKKMFSAEKTFLFIGNVIFDEKKKNLMVNSQMNMIREYIDCQGKYYLGSDNYVVLYKSHPAATWMEDIIKFIYPNVVFIPSSIPIELIFMMGYFPDKIGGFASSSYFSIPKERIHDIVFMTNENDSLDDDYHHEQYKLRNIFIELGIIPEGKAHYYSI